MASRTEERRGGPAGTDARGGSPAWLRARLVEPRPTARAPGRGSGLGIHVARRLESRYAGEVLPVGQRGPAPISRAVAESCHGAVPPSPEASP